MENNTEVKFDTNEILDISNQVIRQIIEEVEIKSKIKIGKTGFFDCKAL